jgi:hypothetical protein
MVMWSSLRLRCWLMSDRRLSFKSALDVSIGISSMRRVTNRLGVGTLFLGEFFLWSRQKKTWQQMMTARATRAPVKSAPQLDKSLLLIILGFSLRSCQVDARNRKGKRVHSVVKHGSSLGGCSDFKSDSSLTRDRSRLPALDNCFKNMPPAFDSCLSHLCNQTGAPVSVRQTPSLVIPNW